MGEGSNMNGKDFVIGVLLGGIIGAAAALLLAPKSGRELRSELTDGYQAVAKRTQELIKQVGEQTDEMVARVKEMTSSLKGDMGNMKASPSISTGETTDNSGEQTTEHADLLHITEEAAATSDRK